MKGPAIVHGAPSWRVAASHVAAFVTVQGGHTGPVRYRLGDRWVAPGHVAPWAEEPVEGLPPMLRLLRGDFLCLPFGEAPGHPPHGESANAVWTMDDVEHEDDRTMLTAHLDLTLMPGRVEKCLTLRDGHAAVYTQHVIRGAEGPMPLGHHAMLRFPEPEGSGLVAVSPFLKGYVAPAPMEEGDAGASALAPGATFDRLDAVPLASGGRADLSRYPARPGFEDLVLLASDPALPFAWTAVTFPGEGYVWFALKNPRVLRSTVLWHSNGGRHYPPWNGRHVNVLGLEEVTAFFHYGLPASAAPNALTADGVPTAANLDPAAPLDVRYVTAVAAIPAGFDRVADVAPEGAGHVRLTARSGAHVVVPLDHGFVAG
jgi:hypothetical protein